MSYVGSKNKKNNKNKNERASVRAQLSSGIYIDGASLTHLCSRWFKIENVFILNKLLIQFDKKKKQIMNQKKYFPYIHLTFFYTDH